MIAQQKQSPKWKRVSRKALTQYELMTWAQANAGYVIRTLADKRRLGAQPIADRLGCLFKQVVPVEKVRQALRSAGMDGACLYAGPEQ